MYLSFPTNFIFVGKERYIESYTSVARRSILGFKKNCTVERTPNVTPGNV
jgi:hypothetical protein